jgi:hypothetical protein
MNSYLQAMLRKTNINRASLRRVTDSIPDTTAEQTLDQKHDKDYSVNEEYSLRSKSIIYNNITTSEHKYLTSSCRSDSKNPWHKNEHGNRSNPKSSRNGVGQQATYSCIKSCNGAGNSSDSIKSASVDSLNRNDYHREASSKKLWSENKLCQSESVKSQNVYEKVQRQDSDRPPLKNEQESSKNRPNFINSLNKYEHNSSRERRNQWEDKTKTTLTTELVAGIIIQGQVTEL